MFLPSPAAEKPLSLSWEALTSWLGKSGHLFLVTSCFSTLLPPMVLCGQKGDFSFPPSFDGDTPYSQGFYRRHLPSPSVWRNGCCSTRGVWVREMKTHVWYLEDDLYCTRNDWAPGPSSQTWQKMTSFRPQVLLTSQR